MEAATLETNSSGTWRRVVAALVTILVVLTSSGPIAQTPSEPLNLLSREGRRTLGTITIDGRNMVALEHLAAIFRLTLNEDPQTGRLTILYQDQSILLSPDQGLVSVSGRLVSLPSQPIQTPQGWLVPIEFIRLALAPVYDTPIELRLRSRLVIIGDIHVPEIIIRQEHISDRSRVNFNIAPDTNYTIVQESQRLTVQFDADDLDTTLPIEAPETLIEEIRIGDRPTWVVIDLGQNFGSFQNSAPTGSNNLIIDILPVTDEANFTPDQSPPSPDSLPIQNFQESFNIRTIVVDPGHGGEEHGTSGPNGTLEKDVTLDVARDLQNAIEQRLGTRVVLTRTGDQTVRLDERAAIANNNKADLFISLHANASVRSSVTGAEVFYLSIDEYSDEARLAAESNGPIIPIIGGSLRDIGVILWETAQVRYLNQSAEFATVLEEELRKKIQMSPRAIQQAPFRVLVGANMPAVLVEMGFISNPTQERQLTSDSFKQNLVDALIEGITKFSAYLLSLNRADISEMNISSIMGQTSEQETR